MRRIQWILGSAWLVLAAGAVPVPAETVKVGVFNAQTVSESTEMGRQIQAELTAFTQQKEKEIGERQQRLSDQRQQLSQQALSLSAEKRGALEKDIQRQALELQSFQETASRELELEYGAATKGFQEKLIVTLEGFGKEEGFALLLDRSQVAWADAAVDVTGGIIDRFNQMFPVPAANP